jgi:DNA-binding NarL/FixJ family response regulator
VIQEFRSREPRRRTVVRAQSEPELTSREWEVLDLLRLGLSTAEIARRLFVSQGTVRSHVAAILRKLRAPDRSSAIRMFDQG